MRRIVIALSLLGLILLLVTSVLPKRSAERTPLEVLRAEYSVKHRPSVDHSKFDVLSGPFARPQAVTKACIACHTERHLEVMQSSHWNWERTEFIPGQGIRRVGKKNILNNFCIGISGNEQSCNRCHIGYGYGDAAFDFGDPYNVDCLACHDNSNLYLKGNAGLPDSTVDLAEVAKHVGKPTRTNCGTCHFFGGGGNNVKHGDLEQALFEPSRDLDVHMAVEGSDMQCVACHTAEQHQMLGKLYSVSSMNRNRVECETCHGALPHDDDILNNHTLKVACQTCHIPTYAKDNPTKLTWDWSTAGQLRDGQPFKIHDDSLNVDTYMSTKGTFEWGKDVQPEYAWFNGTASHYLLGDTFDPQGVLQINTLHGAYEDPDAKIIPVKVHRSKQIYDKKFNYLIQPKTVSNHSGDSAFWKEFDWNKSAAAGMKLVDLPYSGDYGFTQTEMYWPINHMVSPANKSVQCIECHTRTDSRLAGLNDFYIPGRDRNVWVERAGAGALILTLAGVISHAIGRAVVSRKRRKEH